MRVLIPIEYACQFHRFLAGQAHLHCQTAVPDATVVGAVVADDGQVMQERHQHDFIQPVSVSNCLAVMRLAQILYPTRQMADRHQLARNPNRRCCQVVVSLLIVLGEGFMTALKFFVQFITAAFPSDLLVEQ